jgi:hypothetical protein
MANKKRDEIMESHIYDIQVRVLLCKEGGEFVARALEFDLLGYGKTESEALDELNDAIEAQITFAHQMKDPSLLSFKSDGEYFKRWDDAHAKSLREQILGDKSLELKTKATIIPFSTSKLKSLRLRSFKQADAPLCA